MERSMTKGSRLKIDKVYDNIEIHKDRKIYEKNITEIDEKYLHKIVAKIIKLIHKKTKIIVITSNGASGVKFRTRDLKCFGK